MRSRRILSLFLATFFVYTIYSFLTTSYGRRVVSQVSEEVEHITHTKPNSGSHQGHGHDGGHQQEDPHEDEQSPAPPKNKNPTHPDTAPLPANPEDPETENGKPHPKYKDASTYKPPPIKDPFPLLSTGMPPPIPEWNRPKPDLYKEYGLEYAPPLLVGFGRNWPMLLQTVVSYITAGWPPEQIYVVENTGVQMSNAKGKLSLQNPFYLNHDQLKKLGVNIVQTPVLLTFAQLQNFYIHLAIEKSWPYYFWSHMDVLALSYEDGGEGRPRYNESDYKTLYELSLTALKEAVDTDDRWGLRFFAYDHLALVNRQAYEDVGGWDVMIPFYIGDCDMHSRLTMAGWNQKDAKAGIITDVALAMDDLLALYRVPGLKSSFTPPPPPPEKDGKKNRRDEPGAGAEGEAKSEEEQLKEAERLKAEELQQVDDPLAKWRELQKTADDMFHNKHGNKEGRNTWQQGQHGGVGEPYYYPNEGLHEAIEIITEAGRQVYRKKWGHRDCDLIEGAGLQLWDQWKVKQDWKD